IHMKTPVFAGDTDTSVLLRGPRGFVASGGERIYYETYGDGEPVVFCHGLGGNHAIWYQQVREFGLRYRVITWDQRGFGRSSNLTEKAGPEAAVADLKALLDELQIDRAHLIGQSMGGWAVMGFALQHPGRARSLTLADTPAGIVTPALEELLRRKGPPPSSQPSFPLGQHPALGPELVRENFDQAFLYEQIGSVAPAPPADMMRVLESVKYPLDRVHAIKVPVLFVVGQNDPLVPPALVQGLTITIPGSRMVEISNTGHSPYFEAPRRWNEVVLGFLKEVNPPESRKKAT
ncbi:MAG: alpha/beta hydrolase, partial [Singulisphaera sp.]|nr:alpha/beta hydrolase [Singulisphaera sp.]